MDARTMAPKPYVEYFPARIPQKKIQMRVHFGDKVISVPSVSITEPFNGQESYPPKLVSDLDAYQPVMRAPLGL